MFKVDDKIKIKTLNTLLSEGVVSEIKDLEGAYIHKKTKFILLPDFSYYGQTQTIINVDTKDPDIPYFTDSNIWIPKFLVEVKEPTVPIAKEEEKEEEKVYINKFNNKKFGKYFIKLIKLDEKIAEFSSTSFSKLKKHELQYIAKLLMDHGAPAVDLDKTTVANLVSYCFTHTQQL